MAILPKPDKITPQAMKKKLKKISDLIKSRKWLFLGLFILLLVILFGVRPRVLAYLKGPAEKYETSKVSRKDISETISAAGEVVTENQVALKFQTSGKLTWVGVKEGDHVKKWQAIASLDQREVRKSLEKKMNDYLSERWDFEQSHEDYATSGKTTEDWLVSDAIKRILEKAQFDLNNAVLDAEIADLAIELSTLVSPIEGIVTSIETPIAGVNITPATAEFTIANPATMKFVASVDEADVANIRVGQKVIISLDAYPDEEIEGEISKIAFAAVTTRGGGTAFPIEILLPDNVNEKFKVGMNGDAEVILESATDVLVVPSGAVSQRNGEVSVKTIEGKEVKDISVKIGLEDDSYIEILEGLEENQLIITGEKKKSKKN